MLHALDLFGTLIFAISGALHGVRHRLDLLGVTVLAIVTGVSGGILRDLLIGSIPPACLRHEYYLLICVLGAVIVLLNTRRVSRNWNQILFADAIGLGVFTAIGAQKGAEAGLGPVGVIMTGMLTATGGSVVRDMLVREIPAILVRDFYATAAILGAAALLVARHFGAPVSIQLLVAAIVTIALRFIAMTTRLELPKRIPFKRIKRKRRRSTPDM